MAKERKKESLKKLSIAVVAIFAIAASLHQFGVGQVEEKPTPVETSTISVEVSTKEDEVLISASSEAAQRAVSFARNVQIIIKDGEDILNNNYITGNGSVVVDGNKAIYKEGSATLEINNLGEGQVIVVAVALNHTAIVWFNATTTSNGKTLNVVEMSSFARADEDRGLMVSEGYHVSLVDEEGNLIGGFGQQEMAGTAEEEANADSKAEIIVSATTGDSLYAETEVEPDIEVSTPDSSVETTEEATGDDYSSVENEEDFLEEEISSVFAKVIVTDGEDVVWTFFGNGTEKVFLDIAEISIVKTENGLAYTNLGTFYY